MVATSADTVICLRSAISRRPSQNWSSSDTLDLCPLRIIERLITGELTARCAGLRSVTGASEGTTVFDIFFLVLMLQPGPLKAAQRARIELDHGPTPGHGKPNTAQKRSVLGLSARFPQDLACLYELWLGSPPELTKI